jgi:hypothetical protein
MTRLVEAVCIWAQFDLARVRSCKITVARKISRTVIRPASSAAIGSHAIVTMSARRLTFGPLTAHES